MPPAEQGLIVGHEYMTAPKEFHGHTRMVTDVDFDRKYIVSGSLDSLIKVISM